MTTATPSPWWRTLSWASGQCGGLCMSSVTDHAISSGAVQSPARSWPEKTATTPGASLAAERSTPLIRAWANGLRTTSIHSIPGTVMSSVYRAWPVMSSGSSFRRTSVPITRRAVCAIVRLLRARGRGGHMHLLGRRHHGFHDVLVPGAPAQVALEAVSDLLLGERAGSLLDQAG